MKLMLIFTSVLFVAVTLALLATPAMAADPVDQVFNQELCKDNPSGETPSICDVNKNQDEKNNVLVGPTGIITRTAQVLIWLSGTLAMILIVIAGLMFIFSNGNAESASRARSTVIYALIGMTIAIAGQAIVSFVLNRL